MSFKDRAKAASRAALEGGANGAKRARQEMEKRGVEMDGLAAGATDAARLTAGKAHEGLARARDGAAARRADVRAFAGAAVDGLGVADRRGKVKKWRIAKAALRPTKTGRAVATNLALEAWRQRQALRGSGGAPGGEHSIELDDQYFGDLLEWVIADAGIPDDDQNRAQLMLFFSESGIDEVATRNLDSGSFQSYFERVDGECLSLAARTRTLLDLSPELEGQLLLRLDELRARALEAGREGGGLRLVPSSCCGAAMTVDIDAGVVTCETCGVAC
jgi:hypothetical protein